MESTVEIEKAKSVDDVFASGCFDIDDDSFSRVINGPVYGKGFARYLLLKLDHLYNDSHLRMNFETLSVEHILPRKPNKDSDWVKKDIGFNEEERNEWTNKLGNLVLITRHKNSELGRLDYVEKKKRYFDKNINTCPNSLRVLKNYDCWTPKELAENHSIVLNKIFKHYDISNPKKLQDSQTKFV